MYKKNIILESRWQCANGLLTLSFNSMLNSANVLNSKRNNVHIVHCFLCT